MQVIKQNDMYIVADMRGTDYTGDFQLLEITPNCPTGKTCGVYFTRQDALNAFKALTKDRNSLTTDETHEIKHRISCDVMLALLTHGNNPDKLMLTFEALLLQWYEEGRNNK